MCALFLGERIYNFYRASKRHDQKSLRVTTPERKRKRERDAIPDERFILFEGEPGNEGDSS